MVIVAVRFQGRNTTEAQEATFFEQIQGLGFWSKELARVAESSIYMTSMCYIF